MKTVLVLSLLAGAGFQTAPPAGPAASNPSLDSRDKTAIELLSARYALALGSCDAKAWPQLFAADGYFASSARGKVSGRDRLAEMIRSYNCEYVDGVAPPHAPGVLVPYKLEITAAGAGARGIAFYNGGRYEDVYVRTPQGWRFKSRTVMSNKELAAGLHAEDFDAIQRLAEAHGGPYRDVYEVTPAGRRFQSSGVTIELTADGIGGKAYPSHDTGHYEDAYVKTSNKWRFKSRSYVPGE